MATAIESQRVVVQPPRERDPIAFLAACGVLEPRGTSAIQLREILEAYLPSEDEFNDSAFLEARERIGKALKPGESFAQLIVEMREE